MSGFHIYILQLLSHLSSPDIFIKNRSPPEPNHKHKGACWYWEPLRMHQWCFPNAGIERMHFSADRLTKQAELLGWQRKSICQKGISSRATYITHSAYIQHMPLCKIAIKIGSTQRTHLRAPVIIINLIFMKAGGSNSNSLLWFLNTKLSLLTFPLTNISLCQRTTKR